VEDIKVMRRVRKIEEVVRTFLENGVPPKHIFLVGHSAGGWASLLVARRQQVPLNAVIAFAPAFAGRKAHRPEDWQAVHEQHVAFLSTADQLQALVFAFDKDTYNPPQDLVFLRAIPGVRFLHLSEQAIAGVQCQRPNGRRTVFQDCFMQTQLEIILSYIEVRVTTKDARNIQDAGQKSRWKLLEPGRIKSLYESWGMAEHGCADDCLQPAVRSSFQQRLTPGVQIAFP
jgi:pimeloyl-ACP methyl ester carboxylesterase